MSSPSHHHQSQCLTFWLAAVIVSIRLLLTSSDLGILCDIESTACSKVGWFDLVNLHI